MKRWLLVIGLAATAACAKEESGPPTINVTTGPAGTSGVAGTTGAAGATGRGTAGTTGAAGASDTAGATGAAGSDGDRDAASGDASEPGSARADARPDAGAADVGTSTMTLPAPVATWMEHWFEHDLLLTRVGYNDDVAIYFDPDVQRSAVDWLLPYMTEVWRYTRQIYGAFVNVDDPKTDGRLYQIAHTGRYSGGHPSTYFDASHDFRNVSDCGPGPWTDMGHDIPTHEVSHVVEGSNNGMAGSPQFGLWGDSKWAEFFLFDMYTSLGLTADAQRVFDAFSKGADTYPQAGTHWFRDWFYPLWRDHGHAQVMVRYFKLVSQHFPKSGNHYTRSMNMGEFVHFMSGAAGTDLSAQAIAAFGATHPTAAELAKARTDFPQLIY